MSGKFKPFQSKQAEVLRVHTVNQQSKALKLLEKLQRKRPYVWLALDLSDPAAEQKLNGLTGETSVALYIEALATQADWSSPPPLVEALIHRLWLNFNKLHIIQKVDSSTDAA